MIHLESINQKEGKITQNYDKISNRSFQNSEYYNHEGCSFYYENKTI